jgi:cyclase
MHSRRGFLRITLGASWTGAALLEQAVFRATQARAQANAGLPRLFDIDKVADGVYAAVAKPQAILNCNAAIFENASDLLIVDTHSKPSAVNALVAQIRKEITTKPVRYIVNSHFHWDHSQGTHAYRAGNAKVDVIATETTRKLLSESGASGFKSSAEGAARSLDRYKQKLSEAKTPQEKAEWQSVIRQTEGYLAEMKNYAPVLPNVTLDRDLIIHDKAHDLHLAFRGRAHTGGDVVVYCPQKRVLATGDVLHGFAPYIGDGYPTDWPNTLLSFAEFPFTAVIGGHGAVQRTRDRLYHKAQYLEELVIKVQQGRRSRKTLDQIVAETTPDKMMTLKDGGYGDYLVESLWKYTWQPPGTERSTVLAGALAGNLRDVFRRLEKM